MILKTPCPECNAEYVEHEQKGVDVALATQMLKLAQCDAFDQAILVSGDGEYANLAGFLRNALGKRVHVLGWDHGVAPQLRDEAFKVTFLDDVITQALGSAPS